MSARKSADPLSLNPAPTKCLTLPAEAVRVSRNGIEFQSRAALQPWTEMTLSLQRPGEARRITCTGVIVACDENRSGRFAISMLFTNLSRQSQAQLLAYS